MRSIYTTLRSRPQYNPPSAETVRAAALFPLPETQAPPAPSSSRGSLVKNKSRSNSGISTPKQKVQESVPTAPPNKEEEQPVKRNQSQESVASYRSYANQVSSGSDCDSETCSDSDGGGYHDAFVSEFSKVDEIVEALNARADHLLRLNTVAVEKPKRERRVDQLHQLVDDVQLDSDSHDSILEGIRKKFGLTSSPSGTQSNASLSEPMKQPEESSLGDLASVMATTNIDSDFVANLKKKYLYANELIQIERKLSMPQETFPEIEESADNHTKSFEIQVEPETIIQELNIRRTESRDAIVQTDRTPENQKTTSVDAQVETIPSEPMINVISIPVTQGEPHENNLDQVDGSTDETSETSSMLSSMMSSPITTDMISPQFLQVPSSRTTPSITEASEDIEDTETSDSAHVPVEQEHQPQIINEPSSTESASVSSVSSISEYDATSQDDPILFEVVKNAKVEQDDEESEFIDDEMLFSDDEILQVLRRRLKQCTFELKYILLSL